MAKLRGLSLFANVGIAEAYMKNIGVDIVLANEIDIDRALFHNLEQGFVLERGTYQFPFFIVG